MKITILTDEKSWLRQYLPHFIAEVKKRGHTIAECFHETDVLASDCLFILSYLRKVPQEVLLKSAHNIVIHGSELPSGKGWSPVPWQILEGKNEIPFTLFEAAEKIDAGAVYFRGILKLEGHELIHEWQQKVAELVFSLALQFIDTNGTLMPKPQQGKETFYERRTPDDSKLDPQKSIAEQFNLLRVVDNDRFPAFFEWRGHRYTLKIEKQKKSDTP